MQYAVIKTGGKQYRVAPGDTLAIEKLVGDTGTVLELTEVLLTSVDGAVKIGSPLLAGARVTVKVLRQGRAKKIIVFKKKRRKGYRRRQGHRQYETTVQVTGIEIGA